MTPEALLTGLRNQGTVLSVHGPDLAVSPPPGVDIAGARADIVRHKLALRALLAAHWWPAGGATRPCLRELVRRHGVAGFADTLHEVTGCDFDERNPTWEEICVFDAHLRQARPMM